MYNASYTAQATNIWPLSSTPERFSNSNALIRQYRSSLPLPCSDQFVLQIPAQIPGQIFLPYSTFVCGPRDGKHWLSGFVGASRVTKYTSDTMNAIIHRKWQRRTTWVKSWRRTESCWPHLTCSKFQAELLWSTSPVTTVVSSNRDSIVRIVLQPSSIRRKPGWSRSSADSVSWSHMGSLTCI